MLNLGVFGNHYPQTCHPQCSKLCTAGPFSTKGSRDHSGCSLSTYKNHSGIRCSECFDSVRRIHELINQSVRRIRVVGCATSSLRNNAFVLNAPLIPPATRNKERDTPNSTSNNLLRRTNLTRQTKPWACLPPQAMAIVLISHDHRPPPPPLSSPPQQLAAPFA